MKTNTNKFKLLVSLVVAILMFISPEIVNAQRMGHSPARGGGGSRAVSRPAPTQQNRSINGGSARPAPTNRAKPTSRPATRPSQQPQASPAQRPSNNDRTRPNTNNRPSGNTRDNVKNNSRDRVSTGDRNVNSGNRTNINNNRNNINIDNSRNVNINRNVVVRPPYRPYPRPPYYYGGFHYNCFHPYRYHPYRPYYWGPVWHPWGFFVATIAATAIIVSVNNQPYYYDQGVYYIESNGGYTVIEAPVGATIKVLPEGSQTVVINETTNNYYYGGTYYEETGEGYTVVPPTAGTVVENLPEGGEEIKIGDITYVQIGEVYYQPVEIDGKNMYEVVEVKPAEEGSEG